MMLKGRKACRSGDHCDPRTAQDAVYCVVNHSDAEPSTLAERIGVRRGYLLDAANPDRDQVFPLHYVVPLQHAANNKAIVRFLARESGGVFVELPRPDVGPVELLKAIADMTKEYADAISTIAGAISDGTLTPAEADAAIKQLDELIAQASSLRGLVLRVT